MHLCTTTKVLNMIYRDLTKIWITANLTKVLALTCLTGLFLKIKLYDKTLQSLLQML